MSKNAEQEELEGKVEMEKLELIPDDFGRYRGCWIDEDTGHLVVSARIGGENYQLYEPTITLLTLHPHYLDSHQDESDDTYMYFEFKPFGASDC
jgi:hypothetical protein